MAVENPSSHPNNNLQEEARKELEALKLPKEHTNQITKETQKKLDSIKKEIETGEFGMESLKVHLDALKELSGDMKAFYLGSILTALNKKGFYVLGVKENAINLAGGYQLNGKKAPGEEVEGYETILNNYMNSGSFTKADFQKAMLYRSSEMKNFLSQNTDSTGKLLNSPSVDQYAVELLKKYPDLNSQISKDPNGGLIYTEKDEKTYTNWKQAMREKIKENPEDADFLVSYFDSKFYGGSTPFAGQNNLFESYKNTSDTVKTKLDTFTNSFTKEELYSLGIRNPSELEQFKISASQDPIGTLGESIRNGRGWGFIGALIGLIFGKGFKGKLLYALGGFGIAAALGGNTALAKEAWNNKSGAVENVTNSVSETFEKFKGFFSDATEPQQKILEEILGEKSTFLTAPASILGIFNNPQINTLELQKAELEKYGIILTEENKADYEKVFAGLLAKRSAENITIEPNDNINSFLTKTNNANGEEVVNKTPESTPQSTTPESQNSQKEYSEEEKTEILKYFKIENPELLTNLKILGLNPFGFLNNYKIFIETNLSGFEHKEKIILSIQAKLNAVNKKIEELKQEENEKYGNLDQFKNNRWIVNSLIMDLFEQTNTQVLPGAFLLQNEAKISGALHFSSSKDKFVELKNMFNSTLTDDGGFDKSWSSFEVWDASTNNWNIFNTTDDQNIFQQAGWNTNSLAEISLLNKEDKEIEDEAQMWYMGGIAALIANDAASFTGVWTIPGAVIGAGYGLSDGFKDEDLMISILKTAGVIPEEFRTSKEWYDNALAFVGAVPLAGQALRGASKAAKVAEYTSRLNPEQLGKFEQIKAKVAEIFKSKFGGKTSETNTNSVNKVEPTLEGKKISNSLDGIDFNNTDSILKLFTYNWKTIDSTKAYHDGVAIKYAEELQALERQYGKEKLSELIGSIRESYNNSTISIRTVESRIGQQDTWIIWDIAKQSYLNKNPGLSNENYKLGNPFENPEIVQDIIDRHIGWEVNALLIKNGDRSANEYGELASYQYTLLGRDFRLTEKTNNTNQVDAIVEATAETTPTVARALNKNELTVYSDIARKQIGALAPNQSQVIAGIDVRNTGKTGKLGGYIYDFTLPDGTIKNGGMKDFGNYNPDYSKIPDEIRNSGKITNIINPSNKDKTVSIGGEKLLGVFTIKNNKVSIEGDSIKIVTADKTVLKGQAYDDFMNQHFHEILKGFGIKLDKIPNTKLEAIRIKTTNYAKKLNDLAEKTKSPEKAGILRKIASELSHPLRSGAQLLDILVNSTGFTGRGKDLAELLILGDRSKSFGKLSDYQRLAFTSGAILGTSLFLNSESDESTTLDTLNYNLLGIYAGLLNDLYLTE